ncbi:MAG: hypothetical protein IPK02_20990 [Candidatus Accumulibacter sp.]|uniref:Uncharacterized protein n=1 Tax=Candidatus Accumulibacter affinis TaxID=2954384 RepID=A0A935W5I5_9PROT|nr:hypothetical protein [Candidatus Accumulibacter affinis]
MRLHATRFYSRMLAATGMLVLPLTVLATPYTSANRDVLTPNTGQWPLGGVQLGGTRFINLGLQGVGRVAANSIDPSSGESLGSISDMQISSWTRNANGSYSGVFNFLPDRGYNSGSTYSNYAARINNFDFVFTPYTSSATTTAQNQIAMTFAGSTRFTYVQDGNAVVTTGLLASAPPNVSLFGQPVPVTAGETTNAGVTVANRLTFDAEGLIFRLKGPGSNSVP